MHLLRILPLLVAVAACGDNDTPPDPATCGDVRVTPKVYFGSTQPTYVPLLPGQIQAIGSWIRPFESRVSCSGTVIGPRHVLTAAHCGLTDGARFCIGDDTDLATCVRAVAIDQKPEVTIDGDTLELDIAIAELEDDVTTIAPGIAPVPIAVGPLVGLTGERVETSGFGETESLDTGRRLFALERIDAIAPGDVRNGPTLLRVDGRGARGVCTGDSGGPALIVDDAGAVRVAGVLSFGDGSCVDKDLFTRVDLVRDWIESFTGPTPAPPVAPCGPITAEGTCSAERALYCDGDRLVVTACDDCGWDAAAQGYRCLTVTDPCAGEDGVGSCVANVARWCDQGVMRARDCNCLDTRCVIDPSVGATCRELH